MYVTLRNNTARAIPIVLDHPAFRNRKAGFKRQAHPVIDQARDGSKSLRRVQREVQGTIVLPARGEVSGLHAAVKNCAQVKGLLARGAVALLSEQPARNAPLVAERPRRSASTARAAAKAAKAEKGADE
jgi:hypothetical protein